ncbi:MAG: hypothetical protein K0V04_38955 [Deltaproteobacteria bacterium]|nr:hypothetical protein [Deltaproteobacteria bacterium]
MNNRSIRFLSLTTLTIALGVVAGSGLASAQPVASPDIEVVEPNASTELQSIEVAPVEGLETENEGATPATNFNCIAQCWRDFVDCLDHGNCSEEYCQDEKTVCMSYC